MPEQVALAAVERVKQMCRRAFDDGVRAGYQQGFQDGVSAAMPSRASGVQLTDA